MFPRKYCQFYLVLNERTFDAAFDGSVGQHALLVTVESVLEAPVYRPAQRFEMKAASEGALFDWRQFESSRPVGSFPALPINAWNFFLPDSLEAGQLGAGDLEPRTSYVLLVETEGVTIEGSATIPDTFPVRLGQDDERRRLIWPRVQGAAGYRIEIPDRKVTVQTDTVFVVPPDLSPARVTVVAMDTNLFLYSTDPQLARAGIDRGLGVSGAISVGRQVF